MTFCLQRIKVCTEFLSLVLLEPDEVIIVFVANLLQVLSVVQKLMLVIHLKLTRIGLGFFWSGEYAPSPIWLHGMSSTLLSGVRLLGSERTAATPHLLLALLVHCGIPGRALWISLQSLTLYTKTANLCLKSRAWYCISFSPLTDLMIVRQ